MAKPKTDTARINCRVTPTLKVQIEEAARLTGHSLTSFTEMALSEKVRHVFQEQERIALSEQAFDDFLQAIQAPPEKPSRKLLTAVASYRKRHGSKG